MYAPEKARATFLRSRAYRRLNEMAKAEADAREAARQYFDITGQKSTAVGEEDAGETEIGRLKMDDFDSLIAFWSR